MAAATEKKDHRSWPAILGWGSLALFSIGFVWIISAQLGETWSKREEDAIKIAKAFTPPGAQYNLGDLTKVYSLNAKANGAYVGEFQWQAVQKDGPSYEVTLLWKEGEEHRVALWRVDLKSQEVRPQGDQAASLPARAQAGGTGS